MSSLTFYKYISSKYFFIWVTSNNHCEGKAFAAIFKSRHPTLQSLLRYDKMCYVF